MTAPAPVSPILMTWEKLPKALSGYVRAFAPELDGVKCRVATADEGLLIEPVETVTERRKG